MALQRKTARIPDELAARLRRAAYLGRRSESDIITEAVDHWLTNPRKPGCARSDRLITAISDQPTGHQPAATP